MKGFNVYQKFKGGGSLTHKQAILAQCYVCNGESEGGEDCLGVNCPLYQYMPYRKGRQKKQLTQEQKDKIIDTFKRARDMPFLWSGLSCFRGVNSQKTRLRKVKGVI